MREADERDEQKIQNAGVEDPWKGLTPEQRAKRLRSVYDGLSSVGARLQYIIDQEAYLMAVAEAGGQVSQEEIDASNALKEDFQRRHILDGSPQVHQEIFKTLGQITTRNNEQMALETRKFLNSFQADDPQREKKAYWLARTSKSGMLVQKINYFAAELQYAYSEAGSITERIWEEAGITEDTTMEEYAAVCGCKTPAEVQEFLEAKEAAPDAKVIALFTARMREDDPEATDNQVRMMMKEEVVTYRYKNWIKEGGEAYYQSSTLGRDEIQKAAEKNVSEVSTSGIKEWITDEGEPLAKQIEAGSYGVLMAEFGEKYDGIAALMENADKRKKQMPKENIPRQIREVKATYKAQTDLEDKLYLYMLYGAKNNSINDAYTDVNASEAGPDPVKQAIYEGAGVPVRELTKEEDAFATQFERQVMLDLIGDGSREAMEKGIRAFSVIRALNNYENGKVYKECYDKLLKDDPTQDPKLLERNALYMAYTRNTQASYMYQVLNGLAMGYNDLIRLDYTDDLGEENVTYKHNDIVKDRMFKSLGLEDNPNMTMAAYAKKIGFKPYEAKLFFAEMECAPEDKVTDAYRQKIRRDKGDAEAEVSQKELMDEIKQDYTFQLSQSVYLAGFKGQSDKFQAYYSEKMTVDYYLTLMEYTNDQKNAYYQEHNCTAESSISETLRREMTVEQYLKVQGIKKRKDIDSFLAEHHCGLDQKVPEDIQVSDEEVKRAGLVFMNEVLNTPELAVKCIQFQTTNAFANQFEVFGEKAAYEKAKHMTGLGETPQLPEKENRTREELLQENLGNPNLTKEQAEKKTDEQVAYQKWAADVGKKENEKQFKGNVIQAFQDSMSAVASKTPLKMREDPMIAGFFDDRVAESSPTFLKGVLVELEATGKGRKYTNEAKERSGNSEAYEEMVSALKTYHEKTASRDKAGLADARKKLKDKCLAYIGGKEKVRSREFGRVRFDAALAVLYDIMPKKDFQTLLNGINRKREVRAGHKDFVSLDTCNTKYAEIFSAEEAREEERQREAAKPNRTGFPKSYEKQFFNVLNVFGKMPEINADLESVFGDGMYDMFKRIDKDFVPIGGGLRDRSLSDHDFAAIAYGATLTYGVSDLDPRLKDPKYAQDKILLTGKDYTEALAGSPIGTQAADYAQVIEGGRKAAVEALADYAAGDKLKLANILASGIRNVAAMCRLKDHVDDSFYCHGEMGQRMVDMLERDEELKKLVTAEYSNMKDDISYVGSITQAAKIHAKAVKAQKALESAAAPGAEPLSAEQKIELAADVMMLKVLDDSKRMYHKEMEKSPNYQKRVKQVKENAINRMDEAIAIEDKAERERAMDAVDLERQLGILVAKDFVRNDKLLTSLTTDKSTAALRESVKQMVKDAGLGKQSVQEMQQRLNEPKVVQKLSAITSKENEKSGKVFTERKQAEQRERQKQQVKRQSGRKPSAH